MLSEKLALLLKNARRQRKLSRRDLAERAGVSTRLVAELEQGRRPNVSLESALRLLDLAGVSLSAKAPNGEVAELQAGDHSSSERNARAQRRLQTWSGRHVYLHDDREDSPLPASRRKRISAVYQVSSQAHALATAKKISSPRKQDKKKAR